MKEVARAWFEGLQDRIVADLETLEREADPALYNTGPAGRFVKSPWKRGENEGGGTMALLHGRLFEKAGVHVSTVHGEFSPEFRKQIPGADQDPRFWASGISLIIHPRNPNVPAVHMNTRHVVTTKAWFGGGADLTPVLNARRTQEDADTITFHAAMKKACDAHAAIAPYDKYKAWCDEYFFLKHRGEPRGVGGIFFDDFSELGFERGFALLQAVGDAFLTAYEPILLRRKDLPYGERERAFQRYRRGRYVEFNLVWDRGTHFGLQSGGRTESILLSMPPHASWTYRREDPPGSPEALLLTQFLVRREWV